MAASLFPQGDKGRGDPTQCLLFKIHIQAYSKVPTKAIFVYPDPLMWKVPGLLQLAEGRRNYKGCAKIIFLISIIEDLKKRKLAHCMLFTVCMYEIHVLY